MILILRHRLFRWMRQKNLELYELEEVFQHITPSPHSENIPLPLQIGDNESDVHQTVSFPHEERPKNTNYIETNVM